MTGRSNERLELQCCRVGKNCTTGLQHSTLFRGLRGEKVAPFGAAKAMRLCGFEGYVNCKPFKIKADA